MNLTGILKSLLLVVVSIIIWHTHITLLQGVGYGIALAGMFYYALPKDVTPPHQLLLARLVRMHLWWKQRRSGAAGRNANGGEYQAMPGDEYEEGFEDSFLLEEVDKDDQNEDVELNGKEGQRRRSMSGEKVDEKALDV